MSLFNSESVVICSRFLHLVGKHHYAFSNTPYTTEASIESRVLVYVMFATEANGGTNVRLNVLIFFSTRQCSPLGMSRHLKCTWPVCPQITTAQSCGWQSATIKIGRCLRNGSSESHHTQNSQVSTKQCTLSSLQLGTPNFLETRIRI
jgi:hypothetical protein